MMRSVTLAAKPMFRSSVRSKLIGNTSSLSASWGQWGKNATMATVSSLGIDKATGITKPVRFQGRRYVKAVLLSG